MNDHIITFINAITSEYSFLFSAFEAYDNFVTFMDFMNNDEQLLLHIMLNIQHYTTFNKFKNHQYIRTKTSICKTHCRV